MIQEGDRYNRITVIKRSEAKSKDGHSRWLCRCECGNEMFITSTNIPNTTECWECAYRRKSRTYPIIQRGHKKNKQIYYTPDCGGRLLEIINQKNISITNMSKCTGISRSTIYAFLYNGTDTTSARLAKICRYCGVSADYILGLKGGVEHGM